MNNPIDFAYYLQGFAEIGGKPPTEEQWNKIKQKLAETITMEKLPPVPNNTNSGIDTAYCFSGGVSTAADSSSLVKVPDVKLC